MATILLRSPYYETATQAKVGSNIAKSADLSLTITEIGGTTQTISLRKDTTVDSSDNGTVSFEIAEISRDYIDLTFNDSYTSQLISITGTIIFYNATTSERNTGTSASTVGSSNTIGPHKGLDGYYEFMQGLGTGSNSAYQISTNQILIDQDQLFVPENTAGRIPSWDGGAVVYNSFSTSATSITVGSTTYVINRVCSKYDQFKVTFVNKYGAFQDLYFSGLSRENLNVSREDFKRSIITTQGRYDKQQHSIKQFNTLANETITLNTGYVDESHNEAIKQLLVSEQIFIRKTEGGSEQTIPINVQSNTLQFKTGVNDKVINYTITFAYAFDMISNIR
jgi:hypothetical protein